MDLLKATMKSKEMPKNMFKQTLPMPYRCKECKVYGWKPEAREGAKLITIPGRRDINGWTEERTYMFGGLSRDLYSEISCVTFDPMYNEYSWIYLYKGDPLIKRYGHSADEYDGKIVVVGGSKKFNKDMKRRECLSDLLIYDPSTNVWNTLLPAGAYFEPRRYHASCMFGTYLIVNGGLNDKDNILGNTFALNIHGILDNIQDLDKGYRWLQIKPENLGLGPVAYHTCNVILEQDRCRFLKMLSIISMPEIKTSHLKIMYEGLYFFGGKTPSGASNDIYILQLGRKPIEWVKPDIKSKKPPPRYGHSANYFGEKSILIIFGGRNDDNYERSETFCMNDIWIFSAEKLEWSEWINPESPDKCPQARYSHCTAILGKSIIIFGGLNDSNYCSGKLYEIDMTGKTTGLKKNVPRTNPSGIFPFRRPVQKPFSEQEYYKLDPNVDYDSKKTEKKSKGRISKIQIKK